VKSARMFGSFAQEHESVVGNNQGHRDMRSLALAIVAALAFAFASPAEAQMASGAVPAPVKEVCVTPTVTASNAYGINYVVGGLLTFTGPFPSSGSGVIQSIYVNIKDVESSGFTFVPLTGSPTGGSYTDATVAAIPTADKFLPRGTIVLSASSALGTQTTLVATGLGQALNAGSPSFYGLLLANAALTNNFAGTADVQVCADVVWFQ